MELRTCGRSGLRLSALGLGCWQFGGGEYWGEQSQEQTDRVVAVALDLGITYFDTAEAYDGGASETSLGAALTKAGRHRALIGTKVSPASTEPETLVAHCEASLRRLQTDYVDLYMVHWPITPRAIRYFTDEPVRPSVSDAFATLMRLREQGKVRFIGVSNFGLARLDEAREYCPDITANQLPYSLLARGIEWEIQPHCVRRGVGIIGYITLLQGVLADIYMTLDDVPPWQRRTRHFDSRKNPLARHGGHGAEDETNQALGEIRNIAQEVGMTMPEIAIKWALAGEGIACALVGCRSTARLEMNVRAASEPLDSSTVARLKATTDRLKQALGRGFDYYESLENDRTQ